MITNSSLSDITLNPLSPIVDDLQSPDWLAWQQQMRQRFPEKIYARGFSTYKKPIVRRFFQGSEVVFDFQPEQVPINAIVVLWGRQVASDWEQQHCHVIRLEDGFIRSVGLGADLIPPLSWAMDRCGIYYDATHASDLENILQNYPFDAALLSRARLLRERLVSLGLTKYNVGTQTWHKPSLSVPVILVPGQVESDASLAYGALAIKTNLELLKAVRQSNPSAYILYKPHPDVVAGLRQQGHAEDTARQWCDEIILDVTMGQLLAQVDAVHTLTSLSGFEALLRGKQVVCYGLPFYAGWGLTKDILPINRRTRCLSLDELVAGALILYPTYVSRITHQFTSPERALDELLLWREQSVALPGWRKCLRVFLKLEIMLKSHLNNLR